MLMKIIASHTCLRERPPAGDTHMLTKLIVYVAITHMLMKIIVYLGDRTHAAVFT